MLGNFYVLMDRGDCLILTVAFLSSTCLLSGPTHRGGKCKTPDRWIERTDWAGGWELGGQTDEVARIKGQQTDG